MGGELEVRRHGGAARGPGLFLLLGFSLFPALPWLAFAVFLQDAGVAAVVDESGAVRAVTGIGAPWVRALTPVTAGLALLAVLGWKLMLVFLLPGHVLRRTVDSFR